MTLIYVDRIKIGKRFRKEIGDLGPLADSIKEHGILHPIVVAKSGRGFELIVGQRRLAAHQLAFPETGSLIEATVIRLKDPLKAQIDENAIRKDFTFEERMEIADYLEPALKKQAEEHSKKGKKIPLGKFPGGRVEDQIATAFGESGRTFRKERNIWNKVKQGNKHAIDLAKNIDHGRNKSINSVDATLKIYDRRQRLDQEIGSKKQKLEETIKFGDAFDLIQELPNKSVDFCLTSPPFKWPEQTGQIQYSPSFFRILKEIERVTIDGAFIFNSSRNLIELVQVTDPTRILIWYKQITQEPYRYEPILFYQFKTARYNINADITRDVFPYSPPQQQERNHAYENPWQLYEELLTFTHSKTVLDPFLGNGTTYKVCKKMGKTCIGFEIDRSYEPNIRAPLAENHAE